MPTPALPQPPLYLLAGPTAVGKSEVVLRLAGRLNGEIISVDSMQVYHGLDLGTAKPAEAERRQVPHHLLDVVALTESFDAANFVELARAAAREIQGRGKVPILCGGTGLYFKAFLEGLGEAPPSDAALRAELEATPLANLLQELAARDPALFQKIDRQNPRRILRAIEVIRLTGRPFSEQRATWRVKPVDPSLAWRQVLLGRAAPDLKARIDARVDAMFAAGLIAETVGLLERGLASNPTAQQAIGYRQVVEHLRGERSLAETVALVKSRTRQFAKRQMTWFRRQAGWTWRELDPGDSAGTVAARLAADWPGGS